MIVLHIFPQDCNPAKLLQTHLVGGEVHGQKVYVLLDFLQWPHDANLTLNCLLWILTESSKNQKLTPTIYIQLDNCGRENKVWDEFMNCCILGHSVKTLLSINILFEPII